MNNKYRVNFGNGQVHYAGDRNTCMRFIAAHCQDGFAFVQVKISGEWFRAR